MKLTNREHEGPGKVSETPASTGITWELVKLRVLIPPVWGGARGSAVLTRSQVGLLPLEGPRSAASAHPWACTTGHTCPHKCCGSGQRKARLSFLEGFQYFKALFFSYTFLAGKQVGWYSNPTFLPSDTLLMRCQTQFFIPIHHKRVIQIEHSCHCNSICI